MTGTVPNPGDISEPTLVYDRIGTNKRQTWLMMLLFVVVAGGFATIIGLVVGLPIYAAPFIIAALVVYALFSYYASASVALAVSSAHPVTKEEEPDLYRVVENLSIGSGLPMPKVYVIEDSAPNAFATGRDPQHASVTATRGLLNKLDKSELEGVIAHEMSHVGNYDIRVMTITVVLVGIIALLADLFMRWTWFGAGSRSSNRDRGGAFAALAILAIVLAILAPIAAQLIQLAISRQREYLADASGALLCRNPDALARALEKISADPEPLKEANKATAHLYFSNPLHDHSSFLNNLFSTHPPVAERIRLLRAM
ncbi:MAG: zinc metalloprotease HtpX [Dehalococcoidia bacterium]|nr:MAG: zinc metalloprotease HtpX [Dehalococcoidia bacterium]